MTFTKYNKGRMRAGQVVRGEDEGLHSRNQDVLYEARPRLIYVGPSPVSLSTDASNDGWPLQYGRRWAFMDSEGITDPEGTLFWDSMQIPFPSSTLEVHVVTTGVHFVAGYAAEDFDTLKEDITRGKVRWRLSLSQLSDGASSWSDSANIEEQEETYLRYGEWWPSDRSGLSRFLLQSSISYFQSGKPGSSEGNRFTYREGQLWPEDYAIMKVQTFRLESLSEDFDVGRPVRMTIKAEITSIDEQGLVPTGNDPYRTYALSSSVYARGVTSS